MALNLTRLSTGAGIDYLLDTVAQGDQRVPRKSFTEYYDQSGTPPGRWIGEGLEGLDLHEGAIVTANQAYNVFKKFKAPDGSFTLGNVPVGPHDSVAGFDFTFTIPKSVSVLWALADTETQRQILAAHEQAIADTIRWVERTAAHTRSGKDGVNIEPIKGLVTARYHHWDTRDGDPHLHSHVVVLNKGQRVSDGQWRTLDSKALYKAAVTASEIHSNYILDELHRRLGLTFTETSTGSRAVVMDVDGVPREVVDLFSQRSTVIKEQVAADKDAWENEHGRAMTARGAKALDANVWRLTRAPKSKNARTLSTLQARWRERVSDRGINVDETLRDALGKQGLEPLVSGLSVNAADALSVLVVNGRVDEVAGEVVGLLSSSKAVWTLANIRAEVERVTRHVRCHSVQAREEMAGAIVQATVARCVPLTYQSTGVEGVLAPHEKQSLGTETFEAKFSSPVVLDAELTIVDAARSTGNAPACEGSVARAWLDSQSVKQRAVKGFAMAEDQIDAAYQVVTSGALVDAIVGPAGTGKTTTMSAVKEVWERAYGHGMVVGLTTSSQAASVLGAELETPAHTVAKWLYESVGEGGRRRATYIDHLRATLDATTDTTQIHRLRRQLAQQLAHADAWSVRPGQLVIVDEASMTGTLDIATITQQVRDAGGKLLLVGDPAQLDAVDAGGALGLLDSQGHTRHLTSVWRFKNSWEAQASLQLREGSFDALDAYDQADRFKHGSSDAVLENAFQAALSDQKTGKTTVLIASTNAAVRDLNERFTSARRAAGEVSTDGLIPVRSGLDAGVGDVVVSRKIDRQIRDDKGDYIKNGTQLVVEKAGAMGVIMRRLDTDARFTVDPMWFMDNVDLGYAITAHRAQGVTVDTAHLVIPADAHMTRELLYVGMTRGRENNTTWVGVEDHDHAASTVFEGMTQQASWRQRLGTILTNQNRAQSATEILNDSATARTTVDRGSATRQQPLDPGFGLS